MKGETMKKGWIVIGIVWSLASLAMGAARLSSMGTPGAIPTFECLGITAKFVGDDDFDSECTVKYRENGTSEWKQGHPLFTCRKRREYRGSLVHLKPGVGYEIELTAKDPDGGLFKETLTGTTWKEDFPVGQVTNVQNRSTTLNITKSGTPNGYSLYQSPEGQTSVINVNKKAHDCINIKASYVIIRGLKLIRAAKHGIHIQPGCHDIVIEDCDISDFGFSTAPGTFSYANASGIWMDNRSGDPKKTGRRLIIQHNKIHHPSGCADSWEISTPIGGKHPAGPQPISLLDTYGNNVIRYNAFYSDTSHWFNDVVYNMFGSSWDDCDLYGNLISYGRDDAVELEADYNKNVRVWGNVIRNCYMGIATRRSESYAKGDPTVGPIYVWRNMFYEHWKYGKNGGFVLKMRGTPGYYFYNNTVLNAPPSVQVGARRLTTADWVEHFTGKNNIIQTRETPHNGYLQKLLVRMDPVTKKPVTKPVRNNFLDYNLYTLARNKIPLDAAWEKHGIFSTTPSYQKVGQYGYVLKPGSKGIDAGVVIPNFADAYAGKAPDVGACETGIFEMEIGPRGTIKLPPPILVRGQNPAYRLNPSTSQDLRTRVYNVNGQLLLSCISENAYNTMMKRLGKGVYFILERTGNRAQVYRQVILR